MHKKQKPSQNNRSIGTNFTYRLHKIGKIVYFNEF